MDPIRNPYIRDTITIDDAFSDRLPVAGEGSIYILARVIDQRADLRVGVRSVVVVAGELRGNGHLIDAMGPSSGLVGSRGRDAALISATPAGVGGRTGETAERAAAAGP